MKELYEFLKLAFKENKQLIQLYNCFCSILDDSKHELEARARLSNLVDELVQYKEFEVEYIDEEYGINAENFLSFYLTVGELKNLLKLSAPERISGTLISVRGNKEFPLELSYSYEYSCVYKANCYVFEIWEMGREGQGEFSFQLREMENGNDLKVVDLFPDSKKYYLGKGISRAIIFWAKDRFQKRIISSSNKSKLYRDYTEANYKEAINKVWEPLRTEGLVEYDAENDFYYTK